MNVQLDEKQIEEQNNKKITIITNAIANIINFFI